MAKKHVWIPVAAGGLALTVVGGVAIASAMHKNDVTLIVDGAATQLSVREDTVGEVLNLEGVSVGEHDVVLPAADEKVQDGMEISVVYGRQLSLTVDGEERTVWTTARTVEEALAFLGLDAADSKISVDRSTQIGRDGLDFDISTAKNVKVTVKGQATDLKSAGTVGDALAAAGATPDDDDILSQSADTPLTEGMSIQLTVVDQKTTTKEVAIPFEKKNKETSDLDKGKTKVETKGVDGLKTETYVEVYHDGTLQSSTKQSEQVTKEPVTEVTLVGTKEKAKKSEPSPSPTPSPSKPGGGDDGPPATGNTCKASYYWQGQKTANGEQFNPNDLTAAHKSLPFNSRVRVTNPANGKSVTVRINDRGPYIAGRCLDLSKAAMEAIGGTGAGVITVNWQVL